MRKYTFLISVMALVLSIGSLFLFYSINQRLTALGCDVSNGFLAEREYTYPILRTIDDPDNYGKGIDNPLRIKPEYNLPCVK